MASEKLTVKNALKTITGLGSISGTWPTSKTKFPAIVIDLASLKNVDRRDDVAYLRQSVIRVRIFGFDADVIETISDEAESRMTALGYELTFRFDQNADGALQQISHYTKTSPTL